MSSQGIELNHLHTSPMLLEAFGTVDVVLLSSPLPLLVPFVEYPIVHSLKQGPVLGCVPCAASCTLMVP